MALTSIRQKILFGDFDPLVYLKGVGADGVRFFAYLTLSFEQLARLNSDMERGISVELGEYGEVLLEGKGDPSDSQKRYMEDNYAFDHTDPFAEDELTACAA